MRCHRRRDSNDLGGDVGNTAKDLLPVLPHLFSTPEAAFGVHRRFVDVVGGKATGERLQIVSIDSDPDPLNNGLGSGALGRLQCTDLLTRQIAYNGK